jgi:signal peptidase I
MKKFLENILVKHKGLLVVALVLVSMRWSIADHYRVPTGSMEPTIHVGDHILVNKTAYHVKLPFTDTPLFKTGSPQRGDIAVFIFPKDNETRMVKRIIGLPGDKVIVDEQGFVHINGQKMALRFKRDFNREALIHFNVLIPERMYTIQRNNQNLHYKQERREFVVPQGQYFVLGDNRDNSYDSRYWGFVPERNLLGQAHAVAFNFTLNNFIPEVKLSRVGKILD